MNQKTKQIIIAVVVIIVAFFGFKMFFGNPTASTDVPLVAETGTAPQFVDGQAILILLNRLNRVTLNDSIFSNSTFNSLVSFAVPIQDQAIARPNPFAPIGVDISGPVSSVSTSTRATSTVRGR